MSPSEMRSTTKKIMIQLTKVHANLFYLCVGTLLYSPLLILYLNDTTGGFILPTLISAIFITVAALLIPNLLSVKWPRSMQYFDTILIGPAIYVFVVTTFFPLQCGALDGRDTTLSLTVVLIYSGLLFAGFTIPIFIYLFREIKPHFQRAINILGFYSLLAVIYISFTTLPFENGLKEESYYTNVFSKKNNIIILMLDMVQSDFAIEFFRQNKEAEEKFDGFTFYQNTASYGPSTSMSLAGLMRGEILKDVKNVKNINYRNNILDDMTSKGFSVKYHSVVPYSLKNEKLVTIPEGIAIKQRNKYFSFALLCTRRYLPYQISVPWLYKEYGWMSKYDNNIFFKWLIQNSKVDDYSPKSVLWFHTTLTHTPIRFDKNGNFSLELTPNDTIGEISYAFSLVIDFFRRLKELSVYDNSLIIVLSDHGYNTLNEIENLPPGNKWYLTELDSTVSSTHPFVNVRIGQYSPLLMIKPPQSHGSLQYSNTAATLLDLRKTLNEYVLPGSGKEFYGVNILRKNNNIEGREVSIIRFAGKKFENKDFQDTKKYVFDSLKLPFYRNYKSVKATKNTEKHEISETRGISNYESYALIINDLNNIVKALIEYYKDHGVYPKSQGFDGLYTNWGHASKKWIKGLTPSYMANLPRDPRKLTEPDRQYLYISNGKEYKLIAHVPPQLSEVQKKFPELIDPRRPTWAYGFWTEGAKKW